MAGAQCTGERGRLLRQVQTCQERRERHRPRVTRYGGVAERLVDQYLDDVQCPGDTELVRR